MTAGEAQGTPGTARKAGQAPQGRQNRPSWRDHVTACDFCRNPRLQPWERIAERVSAPVADAGKAAKFPRPYGALFFFARGPMAEAMGYIPQPLRGLLRVGFGCSSWDL